MVVENLASFKVKNYKELFKMYKNQYLGIVEQRIPDNLIPLKPSKKFSDLDCIKSLLNEDDDNVYHVNFTGEEYIITILGFCFSKVIDGKKQLITFGEDGRWEEYAELLPQEQGEEEIWDDWQDSSNGTFEMWSDYETLKHIKQDEGTKKDF